jgi:hypothetical protein
MIASNWLAIYPLRVDHAVRGDSMYFTQAHIDTEPKLSPADEIYRVPPPSAREVLEELFNLLEAYGPHWYTEEHHNKALAALSDPGA